MVYGIIELINFAHGDVFMVGTFMSLFFLDQRPRLRTGASATEPADPARWSSSSRRSLFVMPLMGVLNVTIERFAYRPLRHAPRSPR